MCHHHETDDSRDRRTAKPAHGPGRRDFLKGLGAATAGLGLLGLRSVRGQNESRPTPMPVRPLGKTGVSVTAFSLGGEATVEIRQRRDDAVAIINRALDLGVNYIDTSPRYGNGGSESNIGEVMADRRKEVFLATKTHDRTRDGTLRLVEASLRRLQTDRIDLYQLHNVRTEDDVRRALGPDGAVKALEQLREDGVIRFTGITGHRDPDVLRRGIREYPFDCLLMTLNAADIHFRPFQKELLEEAVAREMGIIAMKVTARGRIFREGGVTSMAQALGYTLSFPISTAIVGISHLRELEQNVEIARGFEALPGEERAAIERLTHAYADAGNFFKHRW